MQDLPHNYQVKATAHTDTYVMLSSDGVPQMESSAPAEFGGPGDRWSPETLLVASVGDCFILTFKAIARASKVEWRYISCKVAGKLDRIEKVTRFEHFALEVEVHVPESTDTNKVTRLLEKAEHSCLITNSLTSTTSLECEVHIVV